MKNIEKKKCFVCDKYLSQFAIRIYIIKTALLFATEMRHINVRDSYIILQFETFFFQFHNLYRGIIMA